MNLHQVSPSYSLYLLQNGKTVTDIEEDIASSHATEESIQMTTLRFSPLTTDSNYLTMRNQDWNKTYVIQAMLTCKISPTSSTYKHASGNIHKTRGPKESLWD